MELNLFDQIRNSCRAVAEQASHVRIDFDRIDAYAASLPLEEISNPELDPTCHYLGRGEDTAGFILTLDAVNFGSGYFPYLKKIPGKSGYFTVATSLFNHYNTRGPLSPEDLARLTPDDCVAMFGQAPANAPVLELMTHFASALNDLGHYVLERYHGRWVEMVEKAGGSAERLARMLVVMPYFNDVASYRTMPVAFFKRAQITAADLSVAFSGKGVGRFDDLEQMTIFADNLVPHVLKTDGILIYDAGLSDRINREELIPAGSDEEIEIRACAVDAVERIKSACRRIDRPVASMGLDYLLWNRGQQPYYKSFPRHRTRTVFY
jgi:Queuosine salvage protein